MVITPPLSVPTFKIDETFYLNRVDVSRLGVRSYTLKFNDHEEHYVELQLRGEDTIFERVTTKPASNGDGPATTQKESLTEYKDTRETEKFDRMVRAWKYIYSHGCQSAKGSF